MTFYVGKDLGDLLVVTLNKCVRAPIHTISPLTTPSSVVEATLAIVLLTKCEYVPARFPCVLI